MQMQEQYIDHARAAAFQNTYVPIRQSPCHRRCTVRDTNGVVKTTIKRRECHVSKMAVRKNFNFVTTPYIQSLALISETPFRTISLILQAYVALILQNREALIYKRTDKKSALYRTCTVVSNCTITQHFMHKYVSDGQGVVHLSVQMNGPVFICRCTAAFNYQGT